MTFQFAVRDDDPNRFTDPDELESAYEGYDIPVSFACVPFHGHTRSPAIPESEWEGPEDERFPLGENEALVDYLRAGVERGDLSVMLHGYDHVRTPAGPEFDRPGGLRRKVRDGREHLESLFGDVSVFVPPNNTFCRKGLEAVKIAGMETFYYPTPRDRARTLEVGRMFATDLAFKYRYKATGPLGFVQDAYRFWGIEDRSVFMPVRPFAYRVGGGWEFTSVTLLPSSNVERIKRQMALADRLGGGFCLAVHYWHFEDERFVAKFDELVSYAREELDPEFVHCEDLFGVRR